MYALHRTYGLVVRLLRYNCKVFGSILAMVKDLPHVNWVRSLLLGYSFNSFARHEFNVSFQSKQWQFQHHQSGL
jgi:hypothetical protein